jgi:hypothetical protein
LFHFKNQDDKEEIVEDTYAQMGQGTTINRIRGENAIPVLQKFTFVPH